MKPLSDGCCCGAVRFSVARHLYMQACHCDACKKRTGSAFGLSVVVEADSVTEFTGETRTFARNGDSGKEVRYEFCPKCATTVRWHVDLIPNRQVFAAGAFDRMGELDIVGEMYTDAAMPWARLGCDLLRPGPPDDRFRNAMIERAKLLRQTKPRSKRA